MFRLILNTAVNVYRHFDSMPPAIEIENYRYYTVSNVAQTVAWIVHSGWGILFFFLEIYPFSAIQIVSVGMYVVAINLNRRGHHMISMAISFVELVLHQIVAVKFLGPESGFQFFIPVVGIFPFLIPKGSLIAKASMLVFSIVGYLYIEFGMEGDQPLYQVDTTLLMFFRINNIVMGFGFIAMWAYYLNIAISRAQKIIDKKTRELAKAEQMAEKEKIQHELEVKVRDNEIYKLRNIELKQSFDEILEKKKQIEEEKNKSYNLLLNILPHETADELMNHGKATSKRFESATIIFSDFVGFTKAAAILSADELVRQLDVYFTAFDEIMIENGIEKIKTIGDAYMAVGGVPVPTSTHVFDVVKSSVAMLKFVEGIKPEFTHPFDIRIGIHTGSLVAGVVGNHKFQFDIWGDTVNVAARMEQNSEPGRINISGTTYEMIKDRYQCHFRGLIDAKNKGKIEMYFLETPVPVP